MCDVGVRSVRQGSCPLSDTEAEMQQRKDKMLADSQSMDDSVTWNWGGLPQETPRKVTKCCLFVIGRGADMSERQAGSLQVWIDRRTDRQINRQTDGRMDGRTDR